LWGADGPEVLQREGLKQEILLPVIEALIKDEVAFSRKIDWDLRKFRD